MTCIEGIDPGAHGAVSFIWPEIAKMKVYDLPTYKQFISGNDRLFADGVKLAALVRKHSPTYLYLENVHVMPNDGKVGAFSFGENKGTIKGVHQALDVPFEQVAPQSWQAAMHCPADPKKAVERAKMLFPNCIKLFTRSDKAESAMIALYGVLHQGHRLAAKLTILED
jgi:hypothetical protein